MSRNNEEQLWAVVREGRVSAEVLRRLIDQAKAEESRLREQILMLQGNLQQQQRVRLMIGQLLDQVNAEAAQVETAQTEQPQAAVTAELAEPEASPAEVSHLAAIEAARSAGQCDFTERIGRPVCGKRALKGTTRCKAHQ